MRKLLFIFMIVLSFGFFACAKPEPTPEPDNGGDDKEKKITINYYYDDALIESNEYTNKITLIEFKKDGYTFLGWFLDKDFNIQFDQLKEEDYFKNTTMNLYAKMEKDMKEISINITGIINNEVVLNPLFSWDSGGSDFELTLKLNGEVVEKKRVITNQAQFNKLLTANSNYELTVIGKDSNTKGVITFNTLKEYNNTITSFTLGNPYSDGMVIQRGVENVVAGFGPINQIIKLELDMDDEVLYTVSDDEGYFEITIPAHVGSFIPYNIQISNCLDISKSISNVLFGDVYLFAGQSNMQWPTQNSDYLQSDLESLQNSGVRFFCQDVVTSPTKLEEVKNGRWFKPNANNCMQFSAIATMSGALLGSELKSKMPIGIITAYQGDTNIANWMGPEYYTGTCSTKYLHYNAMVYPLRHTKLTGVVWYQGCNNSALGCDYKDLLTALFKNYRELFNSSKLKYYVIGLACYDGDKGNNFDFSYVRESQALACALDDNAYFISSCDDGDPTYIHPKAKRYICERVSKSILSTVYGYDYLAEGPSYKSLEFRENKVIIELNNAEGLYSTGEIHGMYVAGQDGKYYSATVEIQNEKLVASSEKVAYPAYVKYGFGKSPFVNVFNKDGFSLVPFRTDSYNTDIDLFDYESIDDYYFHPDGSKMTVELTNGNLKVTKAKDGKTYGSVRLDKWGSVAYLPQGFEFTIKGQKSGAEIAIRFIEGDSYEIWGYKVIDDFEGEQTFTVGIGDFVVMYNKQNNIFEPQKIGYIELMIQSSDQVVVELCEARFVSLERTKPMNFMISNVTESDDKVTIGLSKSLFVNTYKIIITTDGNDTPIYTAESSESIFIVDKSLFTPGKPYYIDVEAENELGVTKANNTGFVFYLKDETKVIVCNFDFKDDEALQAYMASSMSVHAGLSATLDTKGVKIVSGGKGWQQFIFKLEPGTGNEMTKLEFYADFSNYKGQVIMQLADTSYNTYSYTINLSEKNEGIFTIDFSSFVKSNTPFTNQTLMWVMFNFNDNTGNGYIILDDVCLSK